MSTNAFEFKKPAIPTITVPLAEVDTEQVLGEQEGAMLVLLPTHGNVPLLQDLSKAHGLRKDADEREFTGPQQLARNLGAAASVGHSLLVGWSGLKLFGPEASGKGQTREKETTMTDGVVSVKESTQKWTLGENGDLHYSEEIARQLCRCRPGFASAVFIYCNEMKHFPGAPPEDTETGEDSES